MEEKSLVHLGRPTKYTAKTIAKGWEYIKNWKSLGDEVPSNLAFADYIGISKTRVYEWKNDPEKGEFRDMLDQISSMQERTLINKGLSSDFNSNICKLMLSKHGYADKQELTGKDGESLGREWTVNVVLPDVEKK